MIVINGFVTHKTATKDPLTAHHTVTPSTSMVTSVLDASAAALVNAETAVQVKALEQSTVPLTEATDGSASSNRIQFKHLKSKELEQLSPSALPLKVSEPSKIYSPSSAWPCRRRQAVLFVCSPSQKTRSVVKPLQPLNSARSLPQNRHHLNYRHLQR